MNDKRTNNGSLASGYLWTFGSTAIPLISAFIVSLIIARTMGPRVVGLINLTMAVATIFLIAAKFGVDGAGSRLISEFAVSSPRLSRPLISSAFLLRLAFTVPTSIVAFLLAGRMASAFKDPDLAPLLRLGALVIFSVSFNELAALLVLGLNRFGQLFAMRLSMLVIRIAIVSLSAALAFGATGVVWAYIAAAAVPGAVVIAVLAAGVSGGADAEAVRDMRSRLWRLSATLAISGASVTIYSLLDKVMLGYYRDADEVGIYSMARNLLETSLFPMFALVMTLRPALAGAWASNDRERCSDMVNRSLTASFAYSMCVATVFACLAGPLITGLFSDSFAASARILILFIPVIVMRSIGSVILPGLVAADKAGTYAKLTVAGAATNFALNAVMIPRWGAQGAVVSTLISYMPIELLGLYALSREIGGLWRRGDLSRAARTVAAAGLIYALYSRLVGAPAGLVATIVHAAVLTAVYLGSLLAMGAVRGRDLLRLLGPAARLFGKGTGR